MRLRRKPSVEIEAECDAVLIAPLDWSLKRPVRSAEQAPTPTAEFSFGAVC